MNEKKSVNIVYRYIVYIIYRYTVHSSSKIIYQDLFSQNI